MLILPLKPVAKIIAVLGTLVFCGYLASVCIEHKNPFGEDYWKAKQAEHARSASAAHH
ncbi:hypothetical protein [Tunturibacter empetritectus]|uniref:Uncharacterized protein n=1 Tax=Tunturiibacter empetritectus TaxID=3069691 RepID=A0A7W8II69_9BACT|nr:hypothetical protein [Edaphobacter lichenicola]MBB5316658.1 hypothetical protein [Edaphobacter lichenicola]